MRESALAVKGILPFAFVSLMDLPSPENTREKGKTTNDGFLSWSVGKSHFKENLLTDKTDTGISGSF